MKTDLNFGGEMQDFGRQVLRTLVETDFGPGCTFDGIDGHEAQDHHGGVHEQVNLFQHGVKDSGQAFRFFERE